MTATLERHLREQRSDWLYRFFCGLRLLHRNSDSWYGKLVVPARLPQVFTDWSSGFLFTSRRRMFWITAGHVLERLMQLGRDRHVVESHLVSPSWSIAHEVPVRILDLPRVWAHRDDVGIDLAAVALPVGFSRMLLASGFQAFRSSAIARIDEEFDEYFLLGFPDIGKDKRLRVGMAAGIWAPVLPLVQAEPPEELVTPLRRRYFRVDRNESKLGNLSVEVVSTAGMSGGPVVGLRHVRGGTSIRLVGVQSGQGSPSGVLTVCTPRKFIACVGNLIDKAIKENGEPEE